MEEDSWGEWTSEMPFMHEATAVREPHKVCKHESCQERWTQSREVEVFMQELEHTAATLAAMDVSDEVLKDAKTEFQGHKAGHKR